MVKAIKPRKIRVTRKSNLSTQTKPKSVKKTPEQSAVDDIFSELEVDTNGSDQLAEETYEEPIVDFDLEEVTAQWEEKVVDYTKELLPFIIDYYALNDAVKGIEDSFRESRLDAQSTLVDQTFMEDISNVFNTSLLLRLVKILFPQDVPEELMNELILEFQKSRKGKNEMFEALRKISENKNKAKTPNPDSNQSNPYGPTLSDDGIVKRR